MAAVPEAIELIVRIDDDMLPAPDWDPRPLEADDRLFRGRLDQLMTSGRLRARLTPACAGRSAPSDVSWIIGVAPLDDAPGRMEF